MKGFSLLELLIVIALLSFIFCLSTGSGYHFYSRNVLELLKDDIKSAVRYARTQAFLQGKTIYLSALSETEDWSEGMMLYELDNQKNKILLRQWQWHFPLWQIHWLGFNSKKVIPFAPNPQFAAMNGQFSFVQRETKQEALLVLNRLGRVRNSG